MQTVFTLSRKIPLAEKETPLNISNLNLKVLHKKILLSSAFKEHVSISESNGKLDKSLCISGRVNYSR